MALWGGRGEITKMIIFGGVGVKKPEIKLKSDQVPHPYLMVKINTVLFV